MQQECDKTYSGKNCSNANVTRHTEAVVTRPAAVQMHCFPVLAEGMSCPYCKTQRACCIAELVASRFTSVGYKSLASWRSIVCAPFFYWWLGFWFPVWFTDWFTVCCVVLVPQALFAQRFIHAIWYVIVEPCFLAPVAFLESQRTHVSWCVSQC